MLQHRWLRTLYAFAFSLFCLSHVFAEQQQAPVVSQPVSAISQDNPLMKMMQGDMGDFQALLEQLLQGQYKEKLAKLAAKRERLMAVLPEELKKDVTAVCAAHKNFTESIKMDACCIRLCQKVHTNVRTIKSPEAVLLNEHLEKLHKALQAGVFTDLVAPVQASFNPTDLTSILQMFTKAGPSAAAPDMQFTVQDVRDTLVVLKMFVKSSDVDVPAEVGQLLEVLEVVEKKLAAGERIDAAGKSHDGASYQEAMGDEQRAVRELAQVCFATLESECEQLIQDMAIVRGKLADALIHAAHDVSSEEREAYDFWIGHLRKYAKTLQSFLELYRMAEVDLSLVMKTMSQVYDIASAFFTFYRFDMTGAQSTSTVWDFINMYVPNFRDLALRNSIVCAGYMHRYTEASSGELQKLILGVASASDYENPLDRTEYQLMLGVQSLFLYFNPTAFGTVQPAKRAFLRIAFAYLGTIAQHNGAWANRDEFLKVAILVTLKELQSVSSDFVQQVIKRNVDPLLLENIETYSMGLIKPEFVDVCFDILFPVFLMQKRGVDDGLIQTPEFVTSVVDLTASDALFGYNEYRFKKHLWKLHRVDVEQALQQSGALNGLDDAVRKIHIDAATNVGFDRYLHARTGFYIKYRLMHYACQNLGFFWGRYLTKTCRGPIHSVLNGAARGIGKALSYFGVVDQELQDAVAQDLNLELVKTLVISLFQDQSAERMMVVGFLKNNRLIAEDVYDTASVNYAIVTQVMNFMIKAHVLTHFDAATLVNEYRAHQDNVTPFVNKLFDTVQENITSAFGGMICGSLASNFAAPYIMDKYMLPAYA